MSTDSNNDLTNHEKLYRSVPLTTGKTIRLLDIQPGRYKSPIHVILREVSPAAQPPYEALSYTWGARTAGHTVRVNGIHDFPVTDNLHNALGRLRRKRKPRTLWVDAICINQEDVDERAKQVAMMDSIYREAACVNVWLGEPGPVGSHYQALLHRLPGGRYRARRRTLFLHLLRYPGLTWKLLTGQLFSIEFALRNTEPAWYKRAWTIQEFILAKKVYLCFGTQRILLGKEWNRMFYLLNSFITVHLKTIGEMPPDEFVDHLNTAFWDFDLKVHQMAIFQPSRNDQYSQQNTNIVLNALRNRSATDPRDMVYCMLGLVSKTERSLIALDYTADYWQVFARATFASIAAGRNLAILQYVSFKDKRPETPLSPTWAVNFADIPPVFYSRAWQSWQHILGAETRLESEHKILVLRGAFCDIVDMTTPVIHSYSRPLPSQELEVAYDCVRTASANFQASISRLGSHQQTVTPKALEDVNMFILRHFMHIWQTSEHSNSLSGGETASTNQLLFPNQPITDIFDEWSRLCAISVADSNKSAQRPSKIVLQDIMHFNVYTSGVSDDDNQYAATSSGLLALATGSVQTGDILVLPKGSNIFLALRPNGDDCYRFRGFAWMPELTSSSVSLWGDEDGSDQCRIKTQEFRIC
jgi:hypothetical protein